MPLSELNDSLQETGNFPTWNRGREHFSCQAHTEHATTMPQLEVLCSNAVICLRFYNTAYIFCCFFSTSSLNTCMHIYLGKRRQKLLSENVYGKNIFRWRFATVLQGNSCSSILTAKIKRHFFWNLIPFLNIPSSIRSFVYQMTNPSPNKFLPCPWTLKCTWSSQFLTLQGWNNVVQGTGSVFLVCAPNNKTKFNNHRILKHQ